MFIYSVLVVSIVGVLVIVVFLVYSDSNGDDIINLGEMVLLYVYIKNVGISIFKFVKWVVSLMSSYVIIDIFYDDGGCSDIKVGVIDNCSYLRFDLFLGTLLGIFIFFDFIVIDV